MKISLAIKQSNYRGCNLDRLLHSVHLFSHFFTALCVHNHLVCVFVCIYCVHILCAYVVHILGAYGRFGMHILCACGVCILGAYGRFGVHFEENWPPAANSSSISNALHVSLSSLHVLSFKGHLYKDHIIK